MTGIVTGIRGAGTTIARFRITVTIKLNLNNSSPQNQQSFPGSNFQRRLKCKKGSRWLPFLFCCVVSKSSL
jgi:hypothetical protein